MLCNERDGTNQEEFEINPDWAPYGVALGVFIALPTIAGNAAVVRAIFRTPSLQNTSNFLLASLAAADLCVGLVVLPLLLSRFILQGREGSSGLGVAVEVLYVQSFTASTYSLCAVTIDRYIAVKLPLRYEDLMNTKTCSRIVTAVWAFSALSGFIRFVNGHVFWFVAAAIAFAIPLTVTAFCYRFMLGEARRQRRNISQQSPDQISTHERNNKAAITVAIVIGTFTLFALPILVVTLTESAMDLLGFCEMEDEFEAGSVWALLVSFGNSALNPFIYTTRKREFRAAFRGILCRKTSFAPVAHADERVPRAQ